MPADVTLVLLHGAGHTGEVWREVRAALHTPSLAVDLPGRGGRPADLTRVSVVDAARSVAADVVDAVHGDIVLVAHSVAGTIVPSVAAALGDRVRHLVLVAGITAPHGVLPLEVFLPGRADMVAARLEELRAELGGRTLEEIDARTAAAIDSLNLSAQPMSWAGVPEGIGRTFVRCLRDPIQPRDLQDRFIASCGASDVIDIDSGHTPALEAPAELAAVLDRIAGRARRTDRRQGGGMRNPHEGSPFDDDDAAIAAALEDVSIPALLCSLVHLTGDPSWIRDRKLPTLPSSADFQGGLGEEERAEIRRLAVPAIAAYRDGGCRPVPLSDDLLLELMSFIAGRPLEGRLVSMLFEDMQFDGADSRAITWGDEIPNEVKAASPVVVIGCGESGILAGIRLSQAGLPFTILDKNEGPGGTWWENRYPGARVDVGSHQYCYSFEPGHHWSEYYCRQPELRDYFAEVLDKYGLEPSCRFGTTVTAVTWDDGSAMWRVDVAGPDGATETIEARFVISAVGSLNLPRFPDIPGMDTFAGPSFHSSRWPDGLDIAGTRFALLGAGASGFQIAPTIASEVGELTIYQRTAQWMFPNPVYRTTVPPGDRWALRHLPFYARWFRFVMGYAGIATGVTPYRIDPDYPGEDGSAINEGNALRREQLEGWIRTNLEGRPDLVEKSIPDYPASGKRILQDDGFWLQALRRPNVELVRTAIERIVPEGVVTVDGTLREADVLCYATGFKHNDFLAPMEVIGRGGRTLREQWGDEPTAYLGIVMPNFPNLFCLYGPGTNLAHSASLFFHSEYQASYALEAIRAVLTSGARTIEVRPDVHDAYAEWHQSEISQLVWAHPSIAHSHYKNPAGKVFTLSPWSIDQYWELTKELNPEDFVLT